MEVTRKTAYLIAAFISLSGCATTQQASLRTQDLKTACLDLRQNTYVNLKLVEGGEVSGYFDTYNRMTNTIYIADRRMKALERGKPYALSQISEIARIQDVAMAPEPPNIIIRAVKSYLTVTADDPQRQLLTQ